MNITIMMVQSTSKDLKDLGLKHQSNLRFLEISWTRPSSSTNISSSLSFQIPKNFGPGHWSRVDDPSAGRTPDETRGVTLPQKSIPSTHVTDIEFAGRKKATKFQEFEVKTSCAASCFSAVQFFFQAIVSEEFRFVWLSWRKGLSETLMIFEPLLIFKDI